MNSVNEHEKPLHRHIATSSNRIIRHWSVVSRRSSVVSPHLIFDIFRLFVPGPGRVSRFPGSGSGPLTAHLQPPASRPVPALRDSL